jgi:hypothetical protein
MKNFLSIGAVTLPLNLDEHGLTLVLGANNDVNGGLSRNGAGKAQPTSANILTPNGFIKMGNLKIGDLVTTPDGSEAPIIGIYPQGKIKTVRVNFSDGRSTECCEDHLWKVWGKFLKNEHKAVSSIDWGWDTLTLQEIKQNLGRKNFSSRTYVPLLEPYDSKDIELPIDPKLLGLLLGDGALEDKRVRISTADVEIKDYIEKVIPEGYILKKYRGNIIIIFPRNSADFRKHNTHAIVTPLRKLDLAGKRSWEKFIPAIYKNSSPLQKRLLLQGLIDTDGTVDRNGVISYCTTSSQLAKDVQEIIWSLGGIANISTLTKNFTYKGVKKIGRACYIVRIRIKDSYKIVSLQRKLDRLPKNYQYNECLRLEITSIEEIENKESQCIMIDHPDHLYITDDYIVTHNTTIAQGINYALYGKPLTKIKIPNLCNNINNKGMLVTLTFEKNNIEYRIERGKKPDLMHFYINNIKVKLEEDDNSEGENKFTQQAIERIVCMSHNMFKQIVILNTMTEPFLRMSAKDQRELIEELLGVMQISQRAEALKSMMVESKDAIKDQNSILRATIEANNRIENAIASATTTSNEWARYHAISLERMTAEIDSLQGIDYDAEIAIFDYLEDWLSKNKTISEGLASATRELKLLNREVSTIEAEISRFIKDSHINIDVQVTRFEQEIGRKNKDISRKSESLIKDKADLLKINDDIANPNEHTCVSCNQKLVGTDHLNTVLDNLRGLAKKLQSKITREENEIIDLEKEIEHIYNEIQTLQDNAEARRIDNESKAEDKRRLLSSPKMKMLLQEKQLAKFEEMREELGEKPNSVFSSRDEIYKTKSVFDAFIHEREVALQQQNPFAAQIDSLRETLQPIDYEPINKLDLLIKHQEFLLKLLTSKDSFIRKKIIDQNLSYLNNRLDHYLDKLGLPHQVKFLNDLSVEITMLGHDLDFEQLSRGEMNRLIMATSWSFRDVWESLNESVNLMFLDEMIDNGLDDIGAESALATLKFMARERHKNIFLISHKDSIISRVDHILTVRKEGGFTQFEHE